MAGSVQRDNARQASVLVAEHLLADTAMVSVPDMLDILFAIKADAIVALAPGGANEALETHRRFKRLSETIDIAINELRALAGLPER